VQEAELCVAKQHLSQSHQQAVLTRLFISLREAVLSQSDSSASKYQVLRKAKKAIQKLEQTLASLLEVKESFRLENGNPSSLEEVREEYVKRHFSNHRSSFSFHSRYLYFYKHTVDLLIEHGIVCAEELPLPEVSTAVSHFWQELSEERRDSVLQYCSQRDFLMEPKPACSEPACTAGGVRDSRGNSEEASGSSVSPEEVKFEDAFDVVASFLDRSQAQEISSQSSAYADCTSENPVGHHRLYLQITDFLKSRLFPSTQLCQEEDLQFDYVTVMLRCTETFDDEDF
ncbi:STRA8 protein, partial [Semnornis frantzii]|nr:STRA8 protein [Semnornis frantzii]